MLRFLIWDLDGTLFDTYPALARAFETALAELGIQAPNEHILALAQVSLDHCVETLARDYQLDPETLVSHFRPLYAATLPAAQPPFPGVCEVLAHIARAGANYGLTHRARASVMRLLAAHDMAGYFSGWVAGDDGYPRKPDPAGVNALLALYQIPHDQTLVVGDRALDVEAGRAAEVRTCLFRGPAGVEADYQIEGYAELLEILQTGSD